MNCTIITDHTNGDKPYIVREIDEKGKLGRVLESFSSYMAADFYCSVKAVTK